MSTLPPHIAFGEKLARYCRFNLSQSCGHSIILGELLEFDPDPLTDLELGYASLAGSSALREQIALFHNEANQSNDYHGDQVLTFCGAQEALRAVYQSVLRPGDEVIVASPAYPSLLSMAAESGALLKSLKLSPENNWCLDVCELRSLFTSKTRLLVLNSPHNPTGMVLDSTARQDIAALLDGSDCYLLVDDVSQGINPERIDLGHDFIRYPKSVVVSVMSKSLGLGGLRIGWAITRDKSLYQALMAFKAGHSICTSAVDERLALVALKNRHNLLQRNNRLVQQNTLRFSDFVAHHQGQVNWVKPGAGLLALAEITCNEPVESWCTRLAKTTGVLLLPASLFGLDGPFVRIGLGQPGFGEGLAALAAFLEQERR